MPTGNKLLEEKVFKDPVHKYIYVQDELIWKLINTKEFQRLRRIRQLGTSFLTFHGAEHSRFSHSLGVYEVTREVISRFERGGVEYADWPQDQRLVTLCAALLHDIGHGPFSHSVEPIFQTDHELWTQNIIRGETEINRVLRTQGADFPDQVAAVIDKTYQPGIVVSLVSGELDADRMDYLLRDAYFTGVTYGTFDLGRILRVLRPLDGRIVVKESGMHAVEAYLMSRYQMYWQVYFHPVTRSSDIILRMIFRRAKELFKQGFQFKWMPVPIAKVFDGKVELDDYLRLDEPLIQTSFTLWLEEDDAVLCDMCERFLYRKLFQYVRWDEHDAQQLKRMRAELEACGIAPDYYLVPDFTQDSSYGVYHPRPAEQVDREASRSVATLDPRNVERKHMSPIMLLDSEGRIAEISTRSEIVRAIAGKHSGQHHLYFPRALICAHAAQLSAETRHILHLDD